MPVVGQELILPMDTGAVNIKITVELNIEENNISKFPSSFTNLMR